MTNPTPHDPAPEVPVITFKFPWNAGVPPRWLNTPETIYDADDLAEIMGDFSLRCIETVDGDGRRATLY